MSGVKKKALDLFRPNRDGESEWVPIESFDSAGLRWTANGNLRRGVPWGLSDIRWEVQRGPGRKVVALRMVGWNDEDAFDQKINPEVRKAFDNVLQCNLSMLPVPKPDREIDHRFGYKEHDDYVELYKSENQSTKDFQLLHRVLNLQKRQMCFVCVETKTRPPHPTLGYAEGDETLPDRFPCKGCFLAEPERFRRETG